MAAKKKFNKASTSPGGKAPTARQKLIRDFLGRVETGDLAGVTKALQDLPGLAHAVRKLDSSGLLVECTGLHLAATKGHLDVVKALVNAGARVDAEDFVEQTPLMNAAMFCHAPVVEYLLQQGANPNHAASEGYTALMYAARNSSVASMDLLLAKGARINQATEAGDTALFFAIHTDPEDRDVVKFLLHRGIDAEAKNSDGMTAAGLAREEGKQDLATFIEDYAEQLEVDQEHQKHLAKQKDIDVIRHGIDHPITVKKPLQFKTSL